MDYQQEAAELADIQAEEAMKLTKKQRIPAFPISEARSEEIRSGFPITEEERALVQSYYGAIYAIKSAAGRKGGKARWAGREALKDSE